MSHRTTVGVYGLALCGGVAEVDDVAECPALEQSELCKLESLREQPSATTLHNAVDEKSILVDQSSIDQGVAQRNAAGDHDVLTLLLFQRSYLLNWLPRQDRGVLPLRIVDR
jgi:hypothetical protein